MIRINLSSEEVKLLQAYFKTSPIKLIREKSQAILLRSRNVAVKDISFSLDTGYRTTERWIKDFSLNRMASIFSGLVGNENAAKLTRSQKEEVKKTLSHPPSVFGLPKEFWDVPQLKTYIKAEFGIVYESIQSYHYLLRFSRLSFKLPDRFDTRRDEVAILQRIREIRKEIKPLLKDPNWKVFAADETGLMFEALTRRAWLKKGAKTVIKVTRTKDKQNYLGFLNLKTGKCHTYRIVSGKQIYILPATRKHVAKYPGKHIAIIWDNATHHKGKLIRNALKKGKSLQYVHLIALPPYAPDTNPIEHVWREGKHATSNHQYRDFETTKQVFEEYIDSRLFNYQI